MSLDPKLVFRHGIQTVLRNAGVSLALSWPWILLLVVIFIVAGFAGSQFVVGNTSVAPNSGTGALFFWIAFLATMFVVVMGFVSVAVNWHRFILRDEFPGVLQRLALGGNVWRYLLRSFMIGLLVVLVLSVPIIIGFFATYPFSDGANQTDLLSQPPIGSVIAQLIVFGVIGILAQTFMFRYGLALPDAALGLNKIGLSESWRLTQGFFGLLFSLSFYFVAMNVGASIVIEVLSRLTGSLSPVAGLLVWLVIGIPVNWFFFFLSITILTTLYGHIVEKRPL